MGGKLRTKQKVYRFQGTLILVYVMHLTSQLKAQISVFCTQDWDYFCQKSADSLNSNTSGSIKKQYAVFFL